MSPELSDVPEVPAPENIDRPVALLGDTHSDIAAIKRSLTEIADAGYTRVLQLGDLCFYPHLPAFAAALPEIEVLCQRLGLHVDFLLGNHDDPNAAALLPRDHYGRGIVSEHLRLMPFGYRFTVLGLSVAVASGAVSVNRDMLTEGVDYFPNEVPTLAQVHRLVNDGPADVLLAHERPLPGSPFPNGLTFPPDVLAEAHAYSRTLRSVAAELGVSWYFHGHHHQRYSDVLDSYRLEGLGRNGDGPGVAWVGFDAQTLSPCLTSRKPRRTMLA